MAEEAGEGGSKVTSRITDLRTLRAIAHPTRLRLYEVLMAGGPATAARLSEYVHGAPGSLSYHLRQLAHYGYIEEASELCTDGRERWWRAIPGGIRFSNADFQDSRGAHEALAAARQALVARQLERLHAWQARGVARFGPQWEDASIATDTAIYLTPEELQQLRTEMYELVARWGEYSRQAVKDGSARPLGDTDSDREQVFIFTHAFPVEDWPPARPDPAPPTHGD